MPQSRRSSLAATGRERQITASATAAQTRRGSLRSCLPYSRQSLRTRGVEFRRCCISVKASGRVSKNIPELCSFEQSRGRSFKVANARGITTFSMFGFLNIAAIIIWIDMSGGPHISDWVTENPWAVAAVMIALLGVHWALGRTLQQSLELPEELRTNGRSLSKGRYLWAWYMGLTLGCWIVTGAAKIVHSSP